MLKKNGIVLLFTCEHASNYIPSVYQHLIDKQLLSTHQAFDIGASDASRLFAEYFKAPLYQGNISRLIVDLNRSTYHNKCFSEQLKMLTQAEKQDILNTYYYPFRNTTTLNIKKLHNIKYNFILHISIHSFTPTLNNNVRKNDIGILYDPKRRDEKVFSTLWANNIKQFSEKLLCVKMNYPYLGTSDGHVTALRKIMSDRYIGIELEINQKLANKKSNTFDSHLINQLIQSLDKAITQFEAQ